MLCPFCSKKLKRISCHPNKRHCFNCNYEYKISDKSISVYTVKKNGDVGLVKILERT